MNPFEIIDNHLLLYNGLEHLEYELSRSTTSYFRVARETHQVLYRSLVESLKGTANLAVTGKPRGRREHRYQFGNEPIKEIHKQSIPGCKHGWRFSTPTIVQSFFGSDKSGQRSSWAGRIVSFVRNLFRRQKPPAKSEDFLIPFHDALAMVQAGCFMHQYVHSQAVSISDREMNLMEWLHERIRNEYEHFIPKGYSAPVNDLLQATKVALAKASACLFESNNVIYYSHSVPKSEMQSMFQRVVALVESHIDKAAGRPTD